MSDHADIDEKTADTILAVYQQELKDAIADGLPEDVIAYAKSRVENYLTDIEQLEEAPWPDVACRTCTGHRLIEVACAHCAGCGGSFTPVKKVKGIQIYLPQAEAKFDDNGDEILPRVNYYPRDEDGRPREVDAKGRPRGAIA